MIQKNYTQTLLEREEKLKPSEAAIQFILNYSKALEVKKMKKQLVFFIKN